MKNSGFASGLFPALLIVLCLSSFSPGQISKAVFVRGRTTSEAFSADLKLLEQQIFDRLNQIRAENGLKKLIWNDEVARIARMHSQNMANFNFFSHVGVDGKRVDGRADTIGLRGWQLIGENIAFNSGFENPAERAVTGWMNSPGHRENILRENWKETGIGIAVGAQGRYYITQVFLRRK